MSLLFLYLQFLSQLEFSYKVSLENEWPLVMIMHIVCE